MESRIAIAVESAYVAWAAAAVVGDESRSAGRSQQSSVSVGCTRETRARDSCPVHQDRPTAAGSYQRFGALSPPAVCLVQTFAVKATSGLAAAAWEDLVYPRGPSLAVAVQEAYGWVVAGAALVHSPQTAPNLPYHLVLAFSGPCHPDACLVQLAAPDPPPTCGH